MWPLVFFPSARLHGELSGHESPAPSAVCTAQKGFMSNLTDSVPQVVERLARYIGVIGVLLVLWTVIVCFALAFLRGEALAIRTMLFCTWYCLAGLWVLVAIGTAIFDAVKRGRSPDDATVRGPALASPEPEGSTPRPTGASPAAPGRSDTPPRGA